jgi:ADP-ribosyl-[dinitrogen reductase] hydrolase
MCAAQPDTGLTLVQILDEEQPYRHLRQLKDPEVKVSDNGTENAKIRRIQGSLMGLAIGDAVGAPVEFRPHAYLLENEVTDMQSGGTWGLNKGQWTDDTSMALCLAASLIVQGKFDAYDQLVRYQRWYRDGYLSSTGKCFDIGKSTRDSITLFEDRRQKLRADIKAKHKNLSDSDLEHYIEDAMRQDKKGFKFGTSESAGNGPLMRLAPIPCFFSDSCEDMMRHIEEATQLTHGDQRAINACQFYGGLIWHALQGVLSKDELLDKKFYRKTLKLNLHSEIQEIAEGSYKKKNGYDGGIRGKGYVANSLEAALWAFYNDKNDFRKGVLLAVNLGDDTDTTAAIYGELAGALYGIDTIDPKWVAEVYERRFIMTVAKGLYIKGEKSRKNPHSTSPDEEREASKTHDGQHPDATKNTSGFDQKTDRDDASDQANQNATGDNSKTTSPSPDKKRANLFSH